MKNKILDILRNNITESKNDYNKIYERDFDNLANELLEAINYTHCCESDSEQLVCDSKGNRCKNSSMDRNGCCRICGEDIAN